MQNRSPILTRDKMNYLLFFRKCEDAPDFQLPPDIIREISGYDPTTNWADYQETLQLVADSELDKVRAKLEAKPFLVLCKGGRAVTPAGLTLADPDQTLLECALGSGDPEMVATIKPYYSQFEGGEAKREEQLARYQPLIDAMETQKPDDLTWLIDIIKESSTVDVAAELATGNAYDWNHKSLLRDALNQFREAKLAPESRTITKPCMHCNYQNLIHAFQLLDDEWDVLSNRTENDYSKNFLVWRQIIGLIELVELPAYERDLFARDGVEDATNGRPFERFSQYKYNEGSFPRFDATIFLSHSGMGFDFGVEIFGAPCEVGSMRAGVGVSGITKLLSSKTSNLQNLCNPTEESVAAINVLR
jgi:hypothetical protein